jgi:hypothetical protein
MSEYHGEIDLPLQPSPQLTPLDVQVGGGHYKSLKIQPIEYIHANGLPYCEANIVKYITRWKSKNGLQDLEKVKHYVDLLIQLEGITDVKNTTV